MKTRWLLAYPIFMVLPLTANIASVVEPLSTKELADYIKNSNVLEDQMLASNAV